MNQPIQHINPEGLFKSPAFSQIVTTQGNGKTIYIVQGEDLIGDSRHHRSIWVD